MQPKMFLGYDAPELDRQYDQRAWAPNAATVIERYATESNTVRSRLGQPTVFSYGDSPHETLDLYRTARSRAPIQVFVHGGAWRLLSKHESAFAAETFVAEGAHFIAIDFALLPQVTLRTMVAQVRNAVAWLYRNAALFGGDRDHIYLSGHSSGAHLAANVVVTDWESEFSLPKDVIKGALCASGIYDLKPVRLSSRSNYVILDDGAEDELSPQRHVDRLNCPLVVAYGELESDEFKRQAREFWDKARRELPHVELIEGIGLNHFELILTLARPDGLLGRAALAQMGLGPLSRDGGGS